MVSGAFFSGLGINIARGHGFSEQDETNHTSVAVISYNYWVPFRARPGVLGKTLYVNGVPMTIVGISAKGFEGSTRRFNRLLDSLSEPRRTQCVGQSPGGRQNIHHQSNLVEPAPDWTPGSRRNQSAGRRANAAGIPDCGIYRSRQSATRRAKTTLSFQDAKASPAMTHVPQASANAHDHGWFVLLIALSNVVMLLMARNATRQREFSCGWRSAQDTGSYFASS